jgi:hypothetical protein
MTQKFAHSYFQRCVVSDHQFALEEGKHVTLEILELRFEILLSYNMTINPAPTTLIS